MRQKWNVTKKIAHAGREPPAIQLGELAGQLLNSKCTNKPYPFAKNIYYIMFWYQVRCTAFSKTQRQDVAVSTCSCKRHQTAHSNSTDNKTMSWSVITEAVAVDDVVSGFSWRWVSGRNASDIRLGAAGVSLFSTVSNHINKSRVFTQTNIISMQCCSH